MRRIHAFIGLSVVTIACAKSEVKPDEGTLGTVDLAAQPTDSPRMVRSAAPVASAMPTTGGSVAPAASVKPASSAFASDAGPASDKPLYDFMKKVVGPAARKDDPSELVGAFERIASLAPAGYPHWASISNDGKTAAKAGNKDAAQAACRGCHEEYKAKYKAELRGRPLP